MAALLLPKVKINIRVYALLTVAREKAAQGREGGGGTLCLQLSPALLSLYRFGVGSSVFPCRSTLISLAAAFLLQVLELCSSPRLADAKFSSKPCTPPANVKTYKRGVLVSNKENRRR